MENNENGFEISKSAMSFFTQYVEKRNIDIMTKPEWEQLYFYCIARTLFPGRKLVSLTVQDLYVIGKTLRLDNGKVVSLLKKCYRFEYEDVRGLSFHDLFEQHAVINPLMEGTCVKFGIVNSLARERMEEILSEAGVFADSSFNRNVLSVSGHALLTLLEGEDTSMWGKFCSMKDKVVSGMMSLLPKNEHKEDNENKIRQIEDMLNGSTINSIAGFVEKAAAVTGNPVPAVAKTVLGTFAKKSGNAILSALIMA